MEFDLFIHEFSYHVVRMSHMSNYGIFFLAIDSVLFIKYAYKRDSLCIEIHDGKSLPINSHFSEKLFSLLISYKADEYTYRVKFHYRTRALLFLLEDFRFDLSESFQRLRVKPYRDCTLNLLSQIETLNPLKQPATACTVQVLDRPATEDRMSNFLRCLV